jgi:hypothetical protein
VANFFICDIQFTAVKYVHTQVCNFRVKYILE